MVLNYMKMEVDLNNDLYYNLGVFCALRQIHSSIIWKTKYIYTGVTPSDSALAMKTYHILSAIGYKIDKPYYPLPVDSWPITDSVVMGFEQTQDKLIRQRLIKDIELAKESTGVVLTEVTIDNVFEIAKQLSLDTTPEVISKEILLEMEDFLPGYKEMYVPEVLKITRWK